MPYEQQVHNFGHVGIDFKVQHTFFFYNDHDQPIKITDIDVSCDCSGVLSRDTLLNPGDTAFFILTFGTADYYGPTNKSFTVFTTHPLLPEIQFFYLATVGQWFNGLKPDPISLFFLPGKKQKGLIINNTHYDEISILSFNDISEFFDVELVKDKAQKGEKLEMSITPSEKLPKGTTLTTFTFTIAKDGEDEATILSIPLKFVKY